MPVVPVDSQLGRVAAYVRRSHGLKLADSIIAATALVNGTTLLTRNVRDFRNVPNLKALKV